LESPRHVALRAAVTFIEVALSTLIGVNVFDMTVNAWQTVAMSGIGAAISVIYNWVTLLRQQLDSNEL